MGSSSLENKTLVLGTALWGWGIDRATAYEILEGFLAEGGRVVDTATNYPINNVADDFGLAVQWIADWVKSNASSALELSVKIGSVDNMASCHTALEANQVEIAADRLLQEFGSSLGCVSIHWDNRGEDESQVDAVSRTVDAMLRLKQQGLEIGLSGIKYPEAYFHANPVLADEWIIQVKENVSTRAARERYQQFFPRARYLAYGINLGGLKVESSTASSSTSLRKINIPAAISEKLVSLLHSDHSFKPRPQSLSELALALSFMNEALSGVIVGPRNMEQLSNTMEYWKCLKETADGLLDIELIVGKQ